MRASDLAMLFAVLLPLPSVLARDAEKPKLPSDDIRMQAPMPREMEPEIRVVSLKHAGPIAICRILDRTFNRPEDGPPSLIVSSDDATKSIVLSARPSVLELAIEVIRSLDVSVVEEPAERSVHVIEIKFADAEFVKKVLRDVAPWRGRRRQFRSSTMIVDGRTNTIIAKVTDAEFELISSLVEKLDVAVPSEAEAEGGHPTYVQIAVYEAQVPQDRVASLDVAQLTQSAGSCESLEAALATFSKPQILYMADQPVELGEKAMVSIGAEVPFVRRGKQETDEGPVATKISYQRAGCIVSLGGGWNPRSPNEGHASIRLEMSLTTGSDIDLAGDAQAPIFRKIDQVFAGPIAAAVPIVLLTVDAGGGGGADTAIAYVTRIVFYHK